MYRRSLLSTRKNWQADMSNVGFTFHTLDEPYWTEDAYYEFSPRQIAVIEHATDELVGMCFAAVDYVIEKNLFHKLKISPEIAAQIKLSWERDDPTLYGRFDLGWDGTGQLKMYEYNADTPTTLLEASIAQYYWKQAYFKHYDQFNSIHEALVEQLQWFKENKLPVSGTMHFAYTEGSEEDMRTAQYLSDVAKEAGIETAIIDMSAIGHNAERECFTDLQDNEIVSMFKLYPWEWMVEEEFAEFAFTDMKYWLEPVWKMVLSNKGLLPILWELYPNHPLLLESYFEEDNTLTNFVKKPILSREGGNITMVEGGKTVASTDGTYGDSGYITQAIHKLPCFDGKYPMIGSWVIGENSFGIGIREDVTLITTNASRFVPHVIR
jgi:Glutathionylspermidine synthase